MRRTNQKSLIKQVLSDPKRVGRIMRQRLKVSRSGVEFIKGYEGFRPEAVLMPDGRYIMGYGHRFSAREGSKVTPEDAESLLRFDLLPIMDAVNSAVKFPLNQHQFDALVSFCFNIGIENFVRSNVVKALNDGRIVDAASALETWRSADINGQTYVLAPLIRRRAAEKALFLTIDTQGLAQKSAQKTAHKSGLKSANPIRPVEFRADIPILEDYPDLFAVSDYGYEDDDGLEDQAIDDVLSKGHFSQTLTHYGLSSTHSVDMASDADEGPEETDAYSPKPDEVSRMNPNLNTSLHPGQILSDEDLMARMTIAEDMVMASELEASAQKQEKREKVKRLITILETERHLRAQLTQLQTEREALMEQIQDQSDLKPKIPSIDVSDDKEADIVSDPEIIPEIPQRHKTRPFAARREALKRVQERKEALRAENPKAEALRAEKTAEKIRAAQAQAQAQAQALAEEKDAQARRNAKQLEQEKRDQILLDQARQQLRQEALLHERIRQEKLRREQIKAELIKKEKAKEQAKERLRLTRLEAEWLEAKRQESERLDAIRLKQQQLEEEAQLAEARARQASRKAGAAAQLMKLYGSDVDADLDSFDEDEDDIDDFGFDLES